MTLICLVVNLITLPSHYYIESLKQNKFIGIHVYNTLRVTSEKLNMVSFTYSRMKSIHAPSAQSRFPVKLICCITFGSASGACCLLKSIVINY